MPAKTPYVPDRSQKKKNTKASVPPRHATGWWTHGGRKLAAARLCERCEAVWYDGHWHTAPGLAAVLRAKSKKQPAKKRGTETLCYECHLAVHGPANPKDKPFEGQLTLDGLKEGKEKSEILATVRNFGKKQERRDPEARIVAIDDRAARVVITTTENQMAVGMGKAVDASHKGGTLTISWSKTDLPARVRWVRKAE